MKKYLILFAISLFAILSCTKEVNDEGKVKDNESSAAPTSFVVSSPETKTTLSGLSIKWAAGDKIRVYGHNTTTDTYTDNAIYELSSGEGEGTAVFTLSEGEMTGTYDEYWAVYPSALTVSGLPNSMTLPRMNASPYHMRMQNPSADQFDSNLAVMTAEYDGSRFVFRHGVAYVKVTIPEDNITKVEINFTNNCLADTPTYNASTGALTSVGNSNKAIASAEGSFVKGESYYFAAIPRSGYTPGVTTVTFTGAYSVSTNHFDGKSPVVGEVYDLGCPKKNFDPIITASDVNIEATDEGGTITYKVDNEVTGGVLTAAIKDAGTISNLSLGTPDSGSLTFTCDANTDATAKTATVRLTYTYNSPAETAIKDVIITQVAAGASAKESHVWNFADFTDDQMKSITGLEADAKATAGQTWNFGDGLTMVTNGSSKWNNQTIGTENYKWVATGGKYGSNQKYFQFTTAHVGTVTILYASGGSASRALTIKANSTETTDTSNVSTATSDMKTVTFSSVASGTIMLYSKDDNVRIYSISFLED